MQASLLRLIGCVSDDEHQVVFIGMFYLSAVWWLDGLVIFYASSCEMLMSLLDHTYTSSLSVCLPLSSVLLTELCNMKATCKFIWFTCVIINKFWLVRFYHAKWYNVSEASGRYPDDPTISQLHDCCETLLQYPLSPSCCLSTTFYHNAELRIEVWMRISSLHWKLLGTIGSSFRSSPSAMPLVKRKGIGKRLHALRSVVY